MLKSISNPVNYTYRESSLLGILSILVELYADPIFQTSATRI